jgi:hypothetical protein
MMIRKYFLQIIFPSLILFSCSQPKDERPADVLPPAKMAIILADIQIADASIQMRGLGTNDSTKLIASGYYRGIFEKRKISEKSFRNSFNWYSHHPADMTAMYENVITEISRRESEAKQ